MKPTFFLIALKDQSGAKNVARLSVRDDEGNELDQSHVSIAVDANDWKLSFSDFSKRILEPATAAIKVNLGL